MGLVQVDEIVHWYNDGSANLGTLASGSVLWLTPATSAGVVTTTPATGHWKAYDTRGADVMTIDWRSKVLAIGGLINCTGPNWAFCAVGSTGDLGDSDLDTHPAIATTPETFVSSAFRTNESGLWILSTSAATGGIQHAASGTAATGSGGLFPLASPVQANDVLWCSWVIGQRSNAASGAGGTSGVPGGRNHVISGLKKVWLAASTFHTTLTGTLLTTKLKGKLVVRLWAYVDEYDKTNSALIKNKALRTNIAAY